MSHSLDLLYNDGLDDVSDAFDLGVDMNERNNVDNLVSMKPGALLSIFCEVSTFLADKTTFFSLQRWFICQISCSPAPDLLDSIEQSDMRHE